MGTHPIFESDFDCLTEKKETRKMDTRKSRVNQKSAVDEFHTLFHDIAQLSVDEKIISLQNICDHLNAVGAIKISDGSLQDFHKALDHVINLLKDQLTTPGKLNETEFVRLWFNLHSYFNNFDTNNSGGITKSEFLESMTGKTSDMDSEEKVSEVFEIADRNNDGSIDFIEFISKLPQLLHLV